MTTKTVELVIGVVFTPPYDNGSEKDVLSSEEALEDMVQWLRDRWAEEVDSYSMVTTVCAVRKKVESE
ncbi:hypothetical protein LCGC14_0725000 [marine sediment metagenome]|uniref:Uncharacterized protein n=1 Tax=marine sediment metagenome TaxID=412755 RepID=A0A0F9SWG3_9ZZZZ